MSVRDGLQDKSGAINGGALYELPIGHEIEDPIEDASNLERTALTTGEGFVRQQGAPSPTIVKWSGTTPYEDQINKMLEFYNACVGRGPGLSRTVFVQQAAAGANLSEVLITDFTRQKVIGRSGRTGLNYVWKWTLTMEVI